MKNLFKSNKTDTNTIHTANSIQKGVITMTTTEKTGTHSFKTRIIAGALTLITAFSVGATVLTSASAAETGKVESITYKNEYPDLLFRRLFQTFIHRVRSASCDAVVYHDKLLGAA